MKKKPLASLGLELNIDSTLPETVEVGALERFQI